MQLGVEQGLALFAQRPEGSTYLADNDGDANEARTLKPLQAAACTYRIAFGPRAGQKVLMLPGALLRDADSKQTLCADSNGFSLHAAVRCGADDRQSLDGTDGNPADRLW